MRLHKKGGNEHEAPCHHKREPYLEEIYRGGGIGADKDDPIFRTAVRSTGTPHRMAQQDSLPDDTAVREAREHQDQNPQ